MGFLMKCPQCGATIAKGDPCPGCRYFAQEGPEKDPARTRELVAQFEKRKKRYERNYTIFMALKLVIALLRLRSGGIKAGIMAMLLATGLLGLSIVVFFYVGIDQKDWPLRGRNAFRLILFLIVCSAIGVLGLLAARFNKLFPLDLKCPSCESRLNDLPLKAGCYCPKCSAQLVSSPGSQT